MNSVVMMSCLHPAQRGAVPPFMHTVVQYAFPSNETNGVSNNSAPHRWQTRHSSCHRRPTASTPVSSAFLHPAHTSSIPVENETSCGDNVVPPWVRDSHDPPLIA